MKFFYAIVREVTFYGVRVTSSPLATCVTKEPGHHVYTVMHRIAGTYGDVGSPPFFGRLVNPFSTHLPSGLFSTRDNSHVHVLLYGVKFNGEIDIVQF